MPTRGTIARVAVVGVWGVLGLLAYGSVFQQLVDQWHSNPSYTHGWIVPPLAGWLLWQRRGTWPTASATWWPGLALIAAAHGALTLGEWIHLPAVQRWSLLVWLVGFVGLTGGLARLRWSLPPIGFLAFMIPLPFQLELFANQGLQSASAWFSSRLLIATGTFAVADTHALLLPNASVQITAACSGMRLSIAIAALSYYLIASRGGPRRSRGVTACLVIPVAILANAVRISLLAVVVDRFQIESLAEWAHSLGDWGVIPLAVVMLFAATRWVTSLLNRCQRGCREAVWALVGPAMVVVVVAVMLRLHSSRQDQIMDQRLAAAAVAENASKWSAAIAEYQSLLRLFPETTDVRYRLAVAHDQQAITLEEHQASLLRYAAILDRQPYHPEALHQHLEKSLLLGLAAPSLVSAQRLYNVRRGDLIALQMHAEAVIRFGSPSPYGITSDNPPQDNPPIDSAAVTRLLRRAEDEAVCRDSFVLACADYAARYPEQVEESMRRRVEARLPEVVHRIDTAESHFVAYRFACRFSPSTANASLARSLTRCRAGIAAPSNAMEVFLACATQARKRGEWDLAECLLNEVAATGRADFRCAWQRGELERARGRWALAVACYQAAWNQTGKQHRLIGAHVAEALLRSGRPDQAFALIAELLSSANDHALKISDEIELRRRLLGWAAESAAACGDDAAACRAIEEYRSGLPRTVLTERDQLRWRSLQRLQATCELRRGRYAIAGRLLEHLAIETTPIEEEPPPSDLLRAAGRAWLAADDPARALRCYRDAVQRGGRLDELWLEYILQLRQHHGHDEARGEVSWREKQAAAGDAASALSLAQAWEIVGDATRAHRHYRQAAEHEPAHVESLAISHARLGRTNQALALIDAADWPKTSVRRAHAAAQIGVQSAELSAEQRERIERLVQDGLRDHGNDVAMLIAAADWYSTQRASQLAIECLSRVVRLRPDDPVAGNNLVMLLAERPEDCGAALQQIDALIQRLGPAAEYLDTKGWVLLRMGRIPEAIGYLTRSVEARQLMDPVTHLHLAAAYLALDDAERAEQQWRVVKHRQLSPERLSGGEQEVWLELRRRIDGEEA